MESYQIRIKGTYECFTQGLMDKLMYNNQLVICVKQFSSLEIDKIFHKQLNYREPVRPYQLVFQLQNQRLANYQTQLKSLNLFQFSIISYVTRKKNGEKQNEIEFITGIRIKLTYAPSEKDKQSPGYQQNKINEQQASNWNNLYEFIMIYVNDLAASKQINQRKISQNRPKPKLPHEDREKSEEKNQITSITGSAKQRGQQRDQNRGTDREQVRSRGGKK